ncbi:MAG: PorV/PorQ family protein [Leptolyngbya sp. SIO3F4]|nr:PorV/PorQ family protein [Leptolyngbya sp. SIO3F4]
MGTATVFGGNEDRIGQAGGQQLMINPWARSSGMANANMASVTGVESIFANVAGLAFTRKTEINFSHTRWLTTSGIGINNLGFAQRVGEVSVIGINVVGMSFGELDRTTEDLPEGGAGTFTPQIGHLSLSYAREFSNSIFAGITVKAISEGLPDARANGVAFDAGIRYVTGKKDNLKFGISLKNVGPRMRFSGDGLAVRNTLDEKEFTLQQRTEPYELPSSLNIGFSYDYYIAERADSAGKEIESLHRLTGAFNYLSNSFGKDQFQFGVEYAFKERFMGRVGLVYEEDLFDENDSQNIIAGPTGGLTVALPISATGSTIDLDYGYRFTTALGGIHSIGLRVNL